MASFGENLRREREMRGVTLQEISAATKISVRFLKAVENENFGQLPGGIFTRSFIRAYARYLGLDDERVLAEFQLLVPADSDFDINRIAATRPEIRPELTRRPLVVVLVAAVLVTGGYLLYRSTRASDKAKPPAAEAPSPQASPASAPETITAPGRKDATAQTSVRTAVAKPAATPRPRAAASGAEASPPIPPAPLGGLVLQVAATERAWIAVDADGEMALQRILEPGDIETLRAKESFDITTGNALGVILTLNGETQRPLGRRGEVKSVRLTRNDLKNISP